MTGAWSVVLGWFEDVLNEGRGGFCVFFPILCIFDSIIRSIFSLNEYLKD